MPVHALRSPRETDTTAVLEAFQSNEEMRRQGGITSPEMASAYVAHPCHPDSPHRALAVVDGNHPVGLVVVTVDAGNCTGRFWYWRHHCFRGRGWTSRAAATVANRALTTGGLARLELGHRAKNPASASVARAAGFVHEGTEREKFLVDGQRIDVLAHGRVPSDARPSTAELAWQEG